MRAVQAVVVGTHQEQGAAHFLMGLEELAAAVLQAALEPRRLSLLGVERVGRVETAVELVTWRPLWVQAHWVMLVLVQGQGQGQV